MGRVSNTEPRKPMGRKAWEPDDVFDLVGDETARRILVLASEDTVSADDLAAALDTSHPTVYRRINALCDYGLLADNQEIDSEGNHYKTFETTVNRISFALENGDCTVDVQPRQSLVEQFDSLWSDLGRSSSTDSIATEDNVDRANRYGDANHG